MEKYLMIGAGAVVGAFSRHWLTAWTAQRFGTNFAFGTLAVNLLGSFLLGFFLYLHFERGLFSPNLRYLLAVGWCASFTTYSTFSWETFRYLQEGDLGRAATNVALTLFGCLLATWGGMMAAKLL